MSPGSEESIKAICPKTDRRRVQISGIVGTVQNENNFEGNYGNLFECSFKRAVDSGIPLFNTVPSVGLVVPTREESNLQLPLPPGMALFERAPIPWCASDSCPPLSRHNFTVKNVIKCHPYQESVNMISLQQVSSIHPATSTDGDSAEFVSSFFHSVPNGGSVSDPVERRLRSQERNRLAAMKSRQRKRNEWERLLKSEAALLCENATLKKELICLRDEVLRMKEDRSKLRDS